MFKLSTVKPCDLEQLDFFENKATYISYYLTNLKYSSMIIISTIFVIIFSVKMCLFFITAKKKFQALFLITFLKNIRGL